MTNLNTIFGDTLNTITASVTVLKVNGPDGLRTLARSLEVPTKGVRKAALTALVAEAIAAIVKVESDMAAKQAAATAALEAGPKERIRNINFTINGNAAIVDGLWELFTKEGGALVNEIHALLTEGGVNVKRGTVVSRLATQRNNGKVSSANDTDDKNRTITFFKATGDWDKATMARKFAKVQ
jgi:phytoene dehydrogenase-like protein